MSLLANSNAIESGGYNIDRSLRFRSSASAYLSRTFGAPTNQAKWTFSAWVKLGAFNTDERIFSGSSAANNTGTFDIVIGANNAIYLSGYSVAFRSSNAVYRDPSAWYHILVSVDTTQGTEANKLLLWVNGSAVTLNTINAITACGLNVSGASVAIGRWYGAGNYFDGYLAEVNFIDGQALTPSSFGQTDVVTGIWTPKKYTGTYGTNGFYLPFSDNTSATTLAYDKSGNGNNWTPNNISTTSGATYDSMTDVPTLTSATAANYCVLNPLNPIPSGGVINDGNLKLNTSNADSIVMGTFGVSSGKWYWEITATTVPAAQAAIGIIGNPPSSLTVDLRTATNGYCYISTGSKGNNGSTSAYGASYTSGDIIGVALDMDAGTLVFYKNNASQGTAYSSLSGVFSPALGDLSGASGNTLFNCNFGQQPFSYTPPTGFKALNTFNLPDPTIKKPNQYMDATTYTGNGGTQSIVNAGAFQPDLVWVKTRSAATDHVFTDSARGVSKYLNSNNTSGESNYPGFGVTAFNSNGFTVVDTAGGGYVVNGSASSQTYVGWQWKESATSGFDIVTGTTPASYTNYSVSHSLGVTPSMIIYKERSGTTNWWVWHKSYATASNALQLNTTNAIQVGSYFGTQTSTVAAFQSGMQTGLSVGYVAYLFAEIAGFSKFGSYTGNGSANGPFVHCGFRPKYILWKQIDSARDWGVWTPLASGNGIPSNNNFYLVPDGSYAQDTTQIIDTLSNGFKQRDSGSFANANGGTYIYAAFAENPFKYSLAR